MVHKGRVTVSKSGYIYVVKVAGKEIEYSDTKAGATKKAGAYRKRQGKKR